MSASDRREWIQWIESMPLKRDRSKAFQNDENFFWRILQKGFLYERYIVKVLRSYGIKDVYIATDQGYRVEYGSEREQLNGDIQIHGLNFEVKSRKVSFNKPEDWKGKYSPIIIDTVKSIDNKSYPVAGYIIASQVTGALMAIPLQTKSHWEIIEKHDNQRNFKEKFYAADFTEFDDEKTFVTKILGLSERCHGIRSGKKELAKGSV